MAADGRMDRVYIDAGTEEHGFVYLYPGQAEYSLQLMNRCAHAPGAPDQLLNPMRACVPT